MLIIFISCGDKIPNASGIMLCPPFELYCLHCSTSQPASPGTWRLLHKPSNLHLSAISTPIRRSSLPCSVAPPQGIIHQVSSIYLHIYHLAASSGLPLLNSTCGYRPRGMYCSPEWLLVDASAPNVHIKHQGTLFATVRPYI
jgi:hypothetical protein